MGDGACCHYCRRYTCICEDDPMNDDNQIPSDAREIDRSEFDDLARQKGFTEGPWVSSFGDGPGEPYVPMANRSVWGVTPSGPVYARGVGMTEPLSDERLQEMEMRVAVASPGPWDHFGEALMGCSVRIPSQDALFIAHSRQDMEDLLEEVRRLRGNRIS